MRRSGVRLDRDLVDAALPEWEDSIGLTAVPGGLGVREMALFHRPTRTLVLTDLVQNLEAHKLPAALRPAARGPRPGCSASRRRTACPRLTCRPWSSCDGGPRRGLRQGC